MESGAGSPSRLESEGNGDSKKTGGAFSNDVLYNSRRAGASRPQSMKVSSPLSLKVSLWLILNLLLLAALGIGFFIVQGGLGLSALVAGPSGERAQALFNVIAGEAAAASGAARDAVLKRFGSAYGADFLLFGPGAVRLAGGTGEIPPEVRERLELRGPPWLFPGRGLGAGGVGPGREGPRDADREAERARRREKMERTFREGTEKAGREPPSGEKARPGLEPGRRGEPAFAGPPAEGRPGRFVARVSAPPGYWIGMRVPFAPAERAGRPGPALLVARVGSLWGLFHLIGLQTWLLAGGGVLALSVLFWLPLVRSITRSIGQLTAATEQIAEGRFETRVDTRRRDELGRLGESVNRMAARLSDHMTGQKRFLGDVAHELCSPLARLQLATGILGEQAPASLQRTVADVREEVQHMSTLVNELLAFTKAGLQPRDVPLTRVELGEVVRAAVLRENAAERVTADVPAGLGVQANAELLDRALGNLLRNALRYGGDAGPVVLTAKREGDRIILTIEDAGPGVPAGDLDRLGEPFFRPEPARTRESGGVGLGLAIVRTCVAACHGEVRFANRAPHGLRVELRFGAA